MATIKPVIVPTKAIKGNKHKVRISVAHNGEVRYILTDIILDSEKQLKNGQIVKRPDAAILNTKLRGLLQRVQQTIDELEYINGLTCAELVFQIKTSSGKKHRTLASVFEEFIRLSKIKESTISTYTTSYNSITKYIRESILIENINHSTILALDKRLHEDKLRESTICLRLSLLRMLLSYAKRCGYVNYMSDPFYGINTSIFEVRQSWLTVDEIKKIRDYKTDNLKLDKCRDLFMLSYYLGGINIIDLMDINFDVNQKSICYTRKKTEGKPKVNKFVEFEIPEEAKAIIKKHKGSDGKLMLTAQNLKDFCRKFFFDYFRLLSKETGIPGIIYYSARKSFAQHALDLGVKESVIDYILGHALGSNKMLYRYVYVTPAMATEAVRKVLDNLK